jgi:hypothetical protein
MVCSRSSVRELIYFTLYLCGIRISAMDGLSLPAKNVTAQNVGRSHPLCQIRNWDDKQGCLSGLYSAGQQNMTIFLAANLDFLRENGPQIHSQEG